MSKTFSVTAKIFLALLAFALAILLAVPFTSYAINRIDSREQAAQQRQAGTGQGNTGGTGGSNGGTSGGNGVTSETDNTNVDEDMAQAMLDELIATGGPATDELPPGTDLDADEVEEEVANVDTSSPGNSFLKILKTIFSRFTNR